MAAEREGASVTLHINEWSGGDKGGAEQHFDSFLVDPQNENYMYESRV